MVLNTSRKEQGMKKADAQRESGFLINSTNTNCFDIFKEKSTRTLRVTLSSSHYAGARSSPLAVSGHVSCGHSASMGAGSNHDFFADTVQFTDSLK